MQKRPLKLSVYFLSKLLKAHDCDDKTIAPQFPFNNNSKMHTVDAFGLAAKRESGANASLLVCYVSSKE